MRAVDQELLEKTEIYQRLDHAIVDRLVRDCPVREYPKNAILTQQGDASEYVHLILSGRVALMAECCDGETTVVTTMGNGEIFVSPATILQMPYLVTSRTTVPSRVLLIPSARFRQALETEHALALMMVDRLARHWRLLVEHLRELKLHTATERLASYLVRHSPVSSGPASFRLADDRKTIAAELGMSSECLSRTFQQLRSYGIRASGSRVEIAEMRKLRDLYRPVARAASAATATAGSAAPRESMALS